MRYKSFAVTYAESSAEKINCDNYFLNGFCKDNPREATQSDSSAVFDGKGLFAVSSGGKSEMSGEEAAYIGVDLLRDFIKSDFSVSSKEYFELANERIMGRMFQNGGKKAAADIAVLNINKDVAQVYCLGDADVFMYSGSGTVKLSENPAKTVKVQRETVDENGNFKIIEENRETAEHLGMSAEKYEISPFVSKKIKIKKDDSFLICGRCVTEKLGTAEIERIMANNRLKNEEKISAVLNRASANDDGGSYTAVMVFCKGRGFGLKSRGFRAFAALLAAALVGLGIFAAHNAIFDSAMAIYNSCRSFIESRHEKPGADELKWIPMHKNAEPETQPETQLPVQEQPADVTAAPAEEQPRETTGTENTEKRKAQSEPSRPNPVVENPVVKAQTPVQTPQYTEPVEEEPVIRNGTAVTEGGASSGRDVELPIDFGY